MSLYHMGLLADRLASRIVMTTEFDLPCAECGQRLVSQEHTRAGATVTVAECPDCGGRYYPEAALQRL